MVASNRSSGLSGPEKAAVFLLSLGEDAAGQIFKHLSDGDVRMLSRAIAKLHHIPPDQVAAVHNEFMRKMSNVDGLTVDGKEFVKGLLVKALGAEGGGDDRGRQLLADLEQPEGRTIPSLTSSLEGIPVETLAKFLENEHPQVAALIVANVDLKRASAIIAALPEKLQTEVVLRVAKLETVAEEAMQEVGEILREQLGEVAKKEEKGELGGTRVAADLLNRADKAIGGRILEELESRDPDVADDIRQQMFTFEDLLQLDNRGMQVVLKEVSREDLLLALKTASEQLRDKIFANVSSRAAEIIKEDMAASGPVKLKDVEKAQRSIVETVRQLEKEGKVVLASGGGDVLV